MKKRSRTHGGSAIRLVRSTASCTPTDRFPRYAVLLRGKKVDELAFDETGYGGKLPTPDGGTMAIGNMPITEVRDQAARLNKLFRRARA